MRAQITALASAAPRRTSPSSRRPSSSSSTTTDLPPPLTNVIVNGHEVDAYWPHARLIVELDSRAWHDNPLAFEDDRARDQDHVLAGDRVIRLTCAARLTRPAPPPPQRLLT